MSNKKTSGPRKPQPDDDRTSWRPADAEDDDREDTERQGQGQSGYGAGRRGDDPAQRYQNRNQSTEPRSDEPPADPGLGLDDRFTGRGPRES